VLGRDIAMAAWRGSTAIVTTADADTAMASPATKVELFAHETDDGSDEKQCSRLDKGQPFRRITTDENTKDKQTFRTKIDVDDMKDTDRNETK